LFFWFVFYWGANF